jgi:hypothetical protein
LQKPLRPPLRRLIDRAQASDFIEAAIARMIELRGTITGGWAVNFVFVRVLANSGIMSNPSEPHMGKTN